MRLTLFNQQIHTERCAFMYRYAQIIVFRKSFAQTTRWHSEVGIKYSHH